MIFRGKVTSKFVSDHKQYVSVQFVFGDFGDNYSHSYEFPANDDIKVGDEVNLTIYPKPVNHPLRRSTDGPAIEGHTIAVINDIREREE